MELYVLHRVSESTSSSERRCNGICPLQCRSRSALGGRGGPGLSHCAFQSVLQFSRGFEMDLWLIYQRLVDYVGQNNWD